MFNNKALFLFLILLFGLLLCSVLGGRCYTEGFQTTTDSGNVPVNSGVTTTDTSATTSANSYDNYDHYSGNAYPTTFYGPNGGTARLVNANGTYAITITDTNGTTTTYVVNGPASSSSTTPTSTSTTPTSSPNSMFASISNQTFYGPNGGSASVFASSNGQYAIQVTSPDGSTTIYTATNTYTYNDQSTSPYSTTAASSSAASSTPPSDYTNNYKNNYYNDPNLSGNSGASAAYVTGPNGNSAGYATGPNGNTIAGTNYNTNGQYDSAMPQGIPASMIPQGQEDLYILKSEIVPPVCPACPQSTACPRKEKCPACPGCKRCPEPAYDCKLVPNYNASNQYLPAPVLNSFSTFGM